MKPFIAPIFMPHMGCPHRCVFCEQERITAQPSGPVTPSRVQEILDQAIRSRYFSRNQEREVAFYGGTFTRLPIGKMEELLAAVAPYMHKGGFQSIRVSTRPDSLDHGRLKLMRDFGVRTVELGAQSMNNRVLSLSKRGHTAKETEGAVHRLRAGGFRVGIQLMPGLPGDTAECFRATIEKVLRLRPDMVRLYPTLVIRGTELADWYRMKTYRPLALEEAVEICAESCIRLEADGIPVIRIGVMSSPSLLMPGQILGGPWHPALGFLVRAAVYRKKIGPHLPYVGGSSKLRIGVPEREIPLFRGYRNQGLRWVETHTGAKIVSVRSDASLPAGQVRIDRL